MKKTLNKILLAGILTILPSCREVEDSPIEQKFQANYEWGSSSREWQKQHTETEKFLEANIGKRFVLEGNCNLDKFPGSKSLAGLTVSELDEYVIASLAQTHLFFHERIPLLIDYLIKNPQDSKGIYENVGELLKDPKYLEQLRKTYNTDEMDCKTISATTFASSILKLRNQNREGLVSLVTGIYFGETAKRGEGHQWVVSNDREIIDPAIRPEGVFESYNSGEVYIPIIETQMHLREGKAKGSTEIVTMPKSSLDYHRRESAKLSQSPK